MEEKYNDLIGDILENSGGKNNFKGKGKPLPKGYLERDVYQNFQKIAKDAGYLPEWLKLQKQIAELINQCETDQDVQVINKKIIKHNAICPPSMQKNIISLDSLEHAKKIW